MATAGFNKGSFFDLHRNEGGYSSSFSLNSGFSSSFAYETNTDSSYDLRYELDYKFQQAYINASNYVSHGKTSTINASYSFHQLYINLLVPIPIIQKKTFEIFFITGPSLNFNFYTKGEYYVWEDILQTVIDSNGNSHPHVIGRELKTYIRYNPSDIAPVGLGWNVGFELRKPVNNKLEVMLHNKYNFILTNTIADFKGVHLFIGSICMGLRYNLSCLKAK